MAIGDGLDFLNDFE